MTKKRDTKGRFVKTEPEKGLSAHDLRRRKRRRG